jgi:hypothetical protein
VRQLEECIAATIRARVIPMRTSRFAQRLAGIRRRPIVCRRCGATLGYARVTLRDGRVHLRDFDGTVRVRWTAEDELGFEHVRDAECEWR